MSSELYVYGTCICVLLYLIHRTLKDILDEFRRRK